MEKKTKKAVQKKPVAEKTEKHAAEQKEKKHAKKTKAFLKIRALLKKKHLPSFRGRFGKESIRRPSIEKWQRWRKPRGEDIVRAKEDGARPEIGYRTPLLIRGLHPSGYKEKIVHNPKELAGLKDCIVRISGTVGRKKRKVIIAEAKKAGLRLAN